MKIIRTPTSAKGGITDEERSRLATHTKMWIDRAMRTDRIEPDKIIPAIEQLYAVSGLKKPRVVIVPSPLVAHLSAGLAASIWYLRKHGKPNGDATINATRAATRGAMDDATINATRAATRAETYDATDDATRDATDDATRDVTISATDAATRDATDAATYAETRDVTRDVTNAATRAATYDATRGAMDDATYAETRDVTDTETDAATYDATINATDAATDAATRGATRAATRDVTRDVTRAATINATDDATDAATYGAKPNWLLSLVTQLTPNAVEFSLGVIKASWKFRQGGNFWAAYDCYLTAMRDVIGLTGLECWEKYEAWEAAAIHGSWRMMHEEFCIVSDFPEILLKDEQNRPHCEFGPSHRWRDGFEIYHLDGVRLDKEMHKRIMSQSMSFGDLMAIENADIRAVALKYNPEAILTNGAQLIDKSERGNELYLIEKTDLNEFLEESEIYFLKMECPTGRTFIEGVEPSFARSNPRADVCQAAALGITPTQYRNLASEG